MNSKDFFDLFKLSKDIDYAKEPYIWGENSPDTGFAILREYPKGKSFIPAKNKNKEDDNLMLLKVFLQKNKQNEDKITIGLTITNVSFYKLENKEIWRDDQFDYSNPLCPTKESIDISKESIQPINLEEMDRFVLNVSNNKFYDIRNNTEVNPKKIIDYIYAQHIETISKSIKNWWLRTRMIFSNYLLVFIKIIGDVLIKIIPTMSGKKIENRFYNLFLEPFHWSNTAGIKDEIEEKNVNYDDLLKKINYPIFFLITLLLLLLYVLKTYYDKDFLHIIDFLQKNKEDQIFSVTIITFTLIFFNYILPNFLLNILNLFIKIHRKLSTMRFEL